MKKLILMGGLAFTSNFVTAQSSVLLTPGNNTITSNSSNNLTLRTQGSWLAPLSLISSDLIVNLILRTSNGDINTGGALTGRSNGIGLVANSNSIKLFLNKNDNVGINTQDPTAQLDVNGFTKLGSDAPAIKMLKLTQGCTTSASSGFPSGEISISHGLTPSKILKVEAWVEYNTNFFVKDGNSQFGYQFDCYITNTTISLRNLAGSASSEIRTKPCKILLTYEE